MTQEFVTLTREVLERTLDTLGNAETVSRKQYEDELFVITAIRAALEHPQNHVPDAGNMVPAGWKLVPVEPTAEMQAGYLKAMSAPWVERYRDMLNAAPQPPTVKECLTVEQPQANQPAMTPIAQRKLDSMLAEGYTISGYSVYHERRHQHGFVTGAGLVGWWKPEGVEYPQPQGEQEPVAEIQVKNGHWIDTPAARTAHLVDGVYKLYTNPQPKRELMDNEARRIYNEATYHASIAVFMTRMDSEQPDADEKGVSGWLQEAEDRVKHRIIEAAHNIK